MEKPSAARGASVWNILELEKEKEDGGPGGIRTVFGAGIGYKLREVQISKGSNLCIDYASLKDQGMHEKVRFTRSL
jgi:hypothetical protein